jgi:hypothetical protein
VVHAFLAQGLKNLTGHLPWSWLDTIRPAVSFRGAPIPRALRRRLVAVRISRFLYHSAADLQLDF